MTPRERLAIANHERDNVARQIAETCAGGVFPARGLLDKWAACVERRDDAVLALSAANRDAAAAVGGAA